MTDSLDEHEVAGRAASFGEVDREIARLALLCDAPILRPGVIERLLQDDASVCGADNRTAFRKLRGMLMFHFWLWDQAARELGPRWASQIEQCAIERLKESLPDLAERLAGRG